MGKIFVYVGTWPALLRNPLPGFEAIGNVNQDIKTGIFGFIMDEDTGELTPAQNYYTDSITSVLKVSPDGNYLFANDEVRERHNEKNAGGGVLSFKINRDTAELTAVSDKPSFGASPTYIDVDREGKRLFVGNLGNPHVPYIQIIKDSKGDFKMSTSSEEGTIALYDIEDDGSLNGPKDVSGFSRDSFETHRNDRSHYHCVMVDPSNQWLLACDTLDRIYVFRINFERNILIPAQEFIFDVEKGSEPRFINFSSDGRIFYVNNQRNSTVDVFGFDAGTGIVKHIERKLTVKDEGNAFKTWTSESAISKDGRHLYIASRGMGKIMRGIECPQSSISIFEIDAINGKLDFSDEIYIKAENPRGIGISPNGKFLFVVSTDNNEIYRFTINEQDGSLENECKVAEVPVPASIVFVK